MLKFAKFKAMLKHILLRVIDLLSQLMFPLRQLQNVINPSSELRVLVYHMICPFSYASDIGLGCVSTESFSKQMRFLADQGYNVLTVGEALKFLKIGQSFPLKAICITFDDGYQNNYLYAYPELLKYGLKATFYLVTGYLATDKRFDWIKPANTEEQDSLARKPLKWEEIAEMREHGMEFASHSHTHPDFSKIDHTTIKWELDESRRLLSDHLHSIGNSFVCPYGVWGKDVEKLKELLLHNDYSSAFFGKWGAITLKADRFDLPRIIIYGEDSIKTFKYKIEGAYDWLGLFHRFYHYLRTVITRRNKENV